MVESSKPHLFGFYKDFNFSINSNFTVAEYVWIDGTGLSLRSKSRTLQKKVASIKDIPDWNYDGSSCYQASTYNSEVILKPVAYYKDPFRQGDNIIVMCETFIWADEKFSELKPSNTNFRFFAKKIFDQAHREEPWFGIEQEYSLMEVKNDFITKPLGWPTQGYPSPQGPYYCSVGANNCFGRAVMDAHYKACLYSGIKISGTNCEVKPGQWEY